MEFAALTHYKGAIIYVYFWHSSVGSRPAAANKAVSFAVVSGPPHEWKSTPLYSPGILSIRLLYLHERAFLKNVKFGIIQDIQNTIQICAPGIIICVVVEKSFCIRGSCLRRNTFEFYRFQNVQVWTPKI